MRLLLVSASSRFLAESCVRAGWSFTAIDFFADWDLQQLCGANTGEPGIFPQNDFHAIEKFQEILGIVSDQTFDGLIVGGGFENRSDLMESICQTINLMGTQPDQLSRLNEPGNFGLIAEIVEHVGGRFPETKTRMSRSDQGADWLSKMIRGAGGHHVARVTDANRRPKPGIIYQRKIAGTNISCLFLGIRASNNIEGNDLGNQKFSPDSVSDFLEGESLPDGSSGWEVGDCRLIGATQQLVGEAGLFAAPFAYCGSIGPINLEPTVCGKVEEIGKAICGEFGIRGIFGIDFIVSGQSVWLIDINPRITASAEIFENLNQISVQETAPGKTRSIVDLHFRACSGQTTTCSHAIEDRQFGKAILFCENDRGLVVSNAFFERLKSYYPSSRDCWVRDIPVSGTVIEPGGPILTLLTQGDSQSDVYFRLMSFAKQLNSLCRN